MELGASFEDDFFEKPPEKKENAPLKYEAKTCSPKWFMDPKYVEENNVDLLNNLRYQADFQYHIKNYREAGILYERCLRLIPPSNSAATRECFENLARSALHENQERKALEWSLRMHAISCNADQSLVSLNLLATVCHKLGKFPEEMEALSSCLEAHRFYPEIWLRLAFCHAGMLGIWLPCSEIQVPVLSDAIPECCPFKRKTIKAALVQAEASELNSGTPALNVLSNSSDPVVDAIDRDNSNSPKCETCNLITQVIAGCLIRTRLLINNTNVNHNLSAIGIEKKETLERKVEACFEMLEMDSDFVEEATRLLQNDLLETMADSEKSLCGTGTSETQNKKSQDIVVECNVQGLKNGS